jgi:signal transduction histidine kinase
MPVGLYVYRLESREDDRSLRVLHCNPSAVRATGVGPHVIGHLIDDCFPGLRRLRIPQLLAEAVRSDRLVDLGEVAYAEDGVREGIYAARAFPLADDCVGVIFEDVATRVHAERRLTRQSIEGRLLHSISAMSAVTEGFENALRQCIRSVCRTNRWSVGLAYLPAGDGSADVVFAGLWRSPVGRQFEELREFCERQRYAPGQDLPGRVFATGEPAWISCVLEAGEFPRSERCAGAGLVGACCLPILVGREVVAVVEFFSRQRLEIDADMVGLLRTIGQQVGRVLERERASQQRETMRDRLHQAQKMEAIGQLAGGIAHDFNNLMTIVRGAIDQLSGQLPGSHPAHRYLEVIEQATEEAVGVTQSLLTFSRDIPGARVAVDLVAVVGETAALLRRMLSASIELRLELPDEPIWILGDSTQLRQVVMNLAINARDAMPGGGTLTVRLSSHRTAGRSGQPRAHLEVCDTGNGIAQEACGRVLEPFFTTKPRGQGTGLGLSIVHGIVQEHDGEIDIRSSFNKGATVVVSLPCMARGERRETAPARPRAPARGGGQLILLAEDHPQVRAILSSALQSLGYEVIKVGDGAAVLNYHRVYQRTVDLLILDIDLPGHGGLECLRELRSGGLNAPAILISGKPEPFEGLSDLGAVLLRKPFRMDELGRVAHRLLKRARRTR